jgi:nucleoside-diphosphate-sugar epimerase
VKVAVFGASGFVGAALAEHLLGRNVEFRAFIGSFGNAWRLARGSVPVEVVDITSASQVSHALEGCTHVVNCTRGSSKVMLMGLKNLLVASRSQKVRRLVHLSSVAVYGDPPPPESEREEASAAPAPGSYGAEKAQQDDMVATATESGLDCVILCPPNISGAYSSFMGNVLGDLRNGSFALLDGGKRPNNTVDVDNLVHAIVLALNAVKGDGKRIFISDGTGYTWKDLIDGLLPLAELSGPVPVIDADSLIVPPAVTPVRASVWSSMKHLVSSDVREALRRDPLWAKFDKQLRRLASAGGSGVEDRLRLSIEGARKVKKVSDQNPYSSRYNAIQLRGVWHRIDRAREVLGYEPPVRFAEGLARYRAWYQTMHGFGAPYWPLVKVLNAL